MTATLEKYLLLYPSSNCLCQLTEHHIGTGGCMISKLLCKRGSVKWFQSDWQRTVVLRVRNQWDQCCHVLSCMAKTIVHNLCFTLTDSQNATSVEFRKDTVQGSEPYESSEKLAKRSKSSNTEKIKWKLTIENECLTLNECLILISSKWALDPNEWKWIKTASNNSHTHRQLSRKHVSCIWKFIKHNFFPCMACMNRISH